ncbi:hypothetical protein M407DRAFT_134822 [Tulasnella calospora MUT 4182]|uniref:Uncharacterized protein n=1 Tax=Tulasnella calospora MUT 4182 TaxID=1051891 RepID=A0A0C3KGL0_9AGAM|nr:hypothetical protein M407DRAFT_134822 [Tulasnella calospora MUT 4182]
MVPRPTPLPISFRIIFIPVGYIVLIVWTIGFLAILLEELKRRVTVRNDNRISASGMSHDLEAAGTERPPQESGNTSSRVVQPRDRLPSRGSEEEAQPPPPPYAATDPSARPHKLANPPS